MTQCSARYWLRSRPAPTGSLDIEEPTLEPATVIQNDKIAAIIERNAHSSLLGVLPREIRDKIWEYVVGAGQIIHLQYNECHRGQEGWCFKLRHKACDAPVFQPVVNPATEGEKSFTGHENCLKDLSSDRWWEICPQNHLGFLLTCRALYVEATQILHNQTTFSFQAASSTSFNAIDSLYAFAQSRNQLQKQSLRKLHVEMDRSSWCKVSARNIIAVGEMLKGLKTLHIDLINPHVYPTTNIIIIRAWMRGLIKLRALDLNTTTVTIGEMPYGHNAEGLHVCNYFSWNVDYGMSVAAFENAETLRQTLLDPNGADIERKALVRIAELEKEREENERLKRDLEMNAELAAEGQSQPKRLRR